MTWAGSVNSASLLWFEPGEVLYIGVSGSYRSAAASSVELTGHFLVSTTLDSVNMGGINVYKYGWDYLWATYEKTVDAKWLVRLPRQVNIERVYPYRDLSELGFWSTT